MADAAGPTVFALFDLEVSWKEPADRGNV